MPRCCSLFAAAAWCLLLGPALVLCDEGTPAAWHVPAALASSVDGAAGFLVKRGLLSKHSMPMVCASCMMDSTYCTSSLCSGRAGITCAQYSCNWPVKAENGSDASPRFCSGVYYNADGRVMVGCKSPADAASACSKQWAPVCGSDNTTYPNSCLATHAGAKARHSGLCDGSPTLATPSPAAHKSPKLPRVNTSVLVVARGCPSKLSPVCGLDNHTYANHCTAEASGMGAYSRGPCTPTPGDVLACASVHQPVCGHNNVTYGNACEARLAGASAIVSGPCGSAAAGAKGNSTVTPKCPREMDPVCGSDNTTYNSSCWARAVGVPVFSIGACSQNLTAAGCSTGPEPVCGPSNTTYITSCIARQWGVSNYTQGACTATSAGYQARAVGTTLLLALVVALGLLSWDPIWV